MTHESSIVDPAPEVAPTQPGGVAPPTKTLSSPTHTTTHEKALVSHEAVSSTAHPPSPPPPPSSKLKRPRQECTLDDQDTGLAPALRDTMLARRGGKLDTSRVREGTVIMARRGGRPVAGHVHVRCHSARRHPTPEKDTPITSRGEKDPGTETTLDLLEVEGRLYTTDNLVHMVNKTFRLLRERYNRYLVLALDKNQDTASEKRKIYQIRASMLQSVVTELEDVAKTYALTPSVAE